MKTSIYQLLAIISVLALTSCTETIIEATTIPVGKAVIEISVSGLPQFADASQTWVSITEQNQHIQVFNEQYGDGLKVIVDNHGYYRVRAAYGDKIKGYYCGEQYVDVLGDTHVSIHLVKLY